MDRRTFIQVSAVTAAGLLVPVRFGKAQASRAAEKPPLSWVTPNEDFYIQDIAGGNSPKVEAEKWRLIINGLAQKPKIIRYPDFMALAEKHSVKTHRTLSCIGDPIGGNQIGNAEWTGIPLRVVLEEVMPRPEAKRVVFRCADTYHTAIPIADAMSPDALLAYKMNGETLPQEHGFPVRLLNPGKYGQKCPKWIVNIEFIAKEYLGYWETRGWSDTAAVRTATRIHAPKKEETLPAGTYRVNGSAFDGGNSGGIKNVQVSTDGGKTWKDAEIWAPGKGLTWSLWTYEWRVPKATGSVKILARAITNKGGEQSQKYEDPYPAGASGYHAVEVNIGS